MSFTNNCIYVNLCLDAEFLQYSDTHGHDLTCTCNNSSDNRMYKQVSLA